MLTEMVYSESITPTSLTSPVSNGNFQTCKLSDQENIKQDFNFEEEKLDKVFHKILRNSKYSPMFNLDKIPTLTYSVNKYSTNELIGIILKRYHLKCEIENDIWILEAEVEAGVKDTKIREPKVTTIKNEPNTYVVPSAFDLVDTNKFFASVGVAGSYVNVNGVTIVGFPEFFTHIGGLFGKNFAANLEVGYASSSRVIGGLNFLSEQYVVGGQIAYSIINPIYFGCGVNIETAKMSFTGTGSESSVSIIIDGNLLDYYGFIGIKTVLDKFLFELNLSMIGSQGLSSTIEIVNKKTTTPLDLGTLPVAFQLQAMIGIAN